MADLALIKHKIFEIRGQKIMLDRDLAEMYGVETKRLNQAVKRNIERFAGDDFMFQLTIDEVETCSRSQIVTLNTTARGHNTKYLPYAFTELGVAMLSSVLRSKTAIEINRGIMRAFVEFRKMATTLPPVSNEIKDIKAEIDNIRKEMDDILADQNDINESNRIQLELINQALAELQVDRKRPKRNPIGFIKPEE